MKIHGSVGRHDPDLTPTFCRKLTLEAKQVSSVETAIEAEFLARLLTEIKAGNVGYWLGKFRTAQKPKRK